MDEDEVGTGFSIDTASAVEVLLLQLITDDRQARRLVELKRSAGSARELLELAAELCREAFARIDQDAIRYDAADLSASVASAGARPVAPEELRGLEDAVTAATRVGSVAQSVQAISMARYAAVDTELVDSDTGLTARVEHALGHQAQFADVDLAAACGMSPRSAATQLSNAVAACTKTPRLLALAVEGAVAFWKVATVAAELCNASAATAGRVEEHVLQSRGFDTWGGVKLRNTTRGLVATWEAEAARRTRVRTVRQLTGVWAGPSQLAGMAELHAVGPADQVARIYGAVDALAHKWTSSDAGGSHRSGAAGAALADDSDRSDGSGEPGASGGPSMKATLGQHRMTALHQLVTADTEVGYQVMVQIPVVRGDCNDASGVCDPGTDTDVGTGHRHDPGTGHDTGTGHDPGTASRCGPEPVERDRCSCSGSAIYSSDNYRLGWARIPGVGFLDPGIVAELNESFGVALTRVLVDADTGVTVETSSPRYVPPGRLRRFVQTRDGTCRFPGCSRPAIRCDLDHSTEWPRGHTASRNLAALCRRHHRAKTARQWDYTMDVDGVCTWTSPTGRRYVTYPDSTRDEQPGDEQPRDEQPGDEQPGDEQPRDEQPGDEQPRDEQPGDEQPRDEQPGEQQPGDDDPSSVDPIEGDPPAKT